VEAKGQAQEGVSSGKSQSSGGRQPRNVSQGKEGKERDAPQEEHGEFRCHQFHYFQALILSRLFRKRGGLEGGTKGKKPDVDA